MFLFALPALLTIELGCCCCSPSSSSAVVWSRNLVLFLVAFPGVSLLALVHSAAAMVYVN
jgi:hypothetical protein